MRQNILYGTRGGKELVYKTYGMTPQTLASDVNAIISWLDKQPHLARIISNFSEKSLRDWLENYLILCKNSVERAKAALDMYFSSKVLLPEVYDRRDPTLDAFKTSADAMVLGVFPERTESGNRVLYFSHTRATADDFEPILMIQRMSMIFEIFLLEGIDFVGSEILVNAKMATMAHFARYNLAFSKRAIDITLKWMPMKFSRIHFINSSPALETMITVLKTLVPAKISERFVIHRNVEDLQRMMGVSALPSDLGGQSISTDEMNRMWASKLESYRDWFLLDEMMKPDESKRVGKCSYETTDATYGHQGSFRKIEVD